MRRVLIMGAGGRDFHDFNVVFRDDPGVEVVGFTATQIPGIAGRRYPPALAGPRYPGGLPIHDEADLVDLIRSEAVDEVVFAYSDVAHVDVMHKASMVLAAGADFRLLGPNATELRAPVPVVAVCAVRTGCGKSPTSRLVGRVLTDAGLRVGLVRHPMPYGDLDAQRVQRFATQADIDAADPTIEEREEYELPVAQGITTWAGVDYAAILEQAAAEADVLIWDGGNNDLPFFAPDLLLVVADALRPGHETTYHPGEAVLRRADVVLVNKVGGADLTVVERLVTDIGVANPTAVIVRAESPVVLDEGPDLAGRRVLCVEDGPTTTHGGLARGAAVVAAEAAGALVVDGRDVAAGAIADTYARFPHLDAAVPAMGYSPAQVRDLEATLDAAECDAIVSGTPFALDRLVSTRHPIRRATYSVAEVGAPTVADVLAPVIAAARRRLSGA